MIKIEVTGSKKAAWDLIKSRVVNVDFPSFFPGCKPASNEKTIRFVIKFDDKQDHLVFLTMFDWMKSVVPNTDPETKNEKGFTSLEETPNKYELTIGNRVMRIIGTDVYPIDIRPKFKFGDENEIQPIEIEFEATLEDVIRY